MHAIEADKSKNKSERDAMLTLMGYGTVCTALNKSIKKALIRSDAQSSIHPRIAARKQLTGPAHRHFYPFLLSTSFNFVSRLSSV